MLYLSVIEGWMDCASVPGVFREMCVCVLDECEAFHLAVGEGRCEGHTPVGRNSAVSQRNSTGLNLQCVCVCVRR